MLFEYLSTPPQPSSLVRQGESCRKQWLQLKMNEFVVVANAAFILFICWGQCLGARLVAELYKISVLFFLTFCGKSSSSSGSKNWFLLLGCLELAFHTGLSHATAIQTFFFKISKHSITDG